MTKVFNAKGIINVHDFPTVNEAVEYVKRVDADETLYEQMLMAPALTDESYSKANQTALLKTFLANIFGQPLEAAYRRNRFVWGQMYIDERRRQVSNPFYSLQEKYHNWVWKVKQQMKLHRVDKGQQQTFPALPTT